MTELSAQEVDLLRKVSQGLAEEYGRKRRLLSFSEYFALVASDPVRQTRNAAQYVLDAFDHYGTYRVRGPGGTVTRYRLFDCPFDGGRDKLVGQEEVQNRVRAVLERFVRQGRVDRLILLHGPNGSSKSTFVDVLARALKHYSTLDEGALYRFNWVFPVGALGKKGIGFLRDGIQDATDEESFAHLPDELIEARLTDELRDHPLLLIPAGRRRKIIFELLSRKGVDPESVRLSDYILYGDLSHRNRLVFEALLAAYGGDVKKVLRHVQVERFFLSRRYRVGLVTVEPKLAVDAATRQLTLDRSLGNLPPVLQNLELFRYSGDLVAANRGCIDFSDLLKRPVEAFKYLLSMVETGKVALEGALLYVDAVFFGSTNELQLAAFRESAEFPSFRGRFEFVSVPYLLDYRAEEKIYRQRVTRETVGRPVAPHALEMAALWAVLTRLYPPDPAKYPEDIRPAVESMTPLEKARFYADGVLPSRIRGDALKRMQRIAEDMVSEYRSWPNYEGNSGVSPRAMLALLADAARRPGRPILSALDVFAGIEELCGEKNLYDFLRRPKQRNGYWDPEAALEAARRYYEELIEAEMWEAVGIVDETRVDELLERYVLHLTAWAKKEKVRNPATGELEPPDEDFMQDMEMRMGAESSASFRDDVVTRVGAWALSHPGEKPVLRQLFARELENFLDGVYENRVKTLVLRLGDLVALLEERLGPGDEGHAQAEAMRQRLEALGYDRSAMLEAVGLVLQRLAEKA